MNPMSKEVFAELVDAHYAPLFRFALSLARNTADAGDLVQQTFFIWATKGHGLREAAKAKSWLFTTLYREFLRNRRRQTRSTSLDDLPIGETEPTAEQVDSAVRLDAAAALTAVQAVDEVFRAPLTLFYLEELSYEEISAVLAVPIGTVMSRLFRGKAQLREILSRGQSEAGSRVIPFSAAQGGSPA